MALSIAAYGFLIAERSPIPPAASFVRYSEVSSLLHMAAIKQPIVVLGFSSSLWNARPVQKPDTPLFRRWLGVSAK